MISRTRVHLAAAIVVFAAACSRPPEAPEVPATPTPQAATFVDRVWRVTESSAVAPGTLYAFLSDGTLVVTSPGSKPMVGSWARAGDGLVMVEESVSYPTDVISLTATTFVIRSHNPGEPVEITMVPAEGS
jgi:hypothetical protein